MIGKLKHSIGKLKTWKPILDDPKDQGGHNRSAIGLGDHYKGVERLKSLC